MKLSIVIPVYNEKATLLELLEKVEEAPLPAGVEKEIILVDDYSTDGSREIVKSITSPHCKTIFHDRNTGKGGALKTGFSNVTGDIIIVQDADLEYFPNEYQKVIQPILDGKADVVYGSRFLEADTRKVVHYWHMMGNKVLTFLSNLFTDLALTDMETCYKAFRKEILDKIQLEEKRFGFEPEITAKIASLIRSEGIVLCETRITYNSRSFREGKKIGIKDAFRTLWCIAKYNESGLAKFVKYVLMGLLVAISQFSTMIFLVEALDFVSVVKQNIAYAISIEVSIITGFFLHSIFTWRHRFRSLSDGMVKFLQFNSITGISFAVRQVLFYLLLLAGVGYLLNTFIGAVIAVLINFTGYERIVFKKKQGS
ncbi:MAG: glycosyltransferase [Proteobacteria bacterium]|nr:glycosyltransferase [Pseudomonadota bacterium]